jgi:hypothetical protein
MPEYQKVSFVLNVWIESSIDSLQLLVTAIDAWDFLACSSIPQSLLLLLHGCLLLCYHIITWLSALCCSLFINDISCISPFSVAIIKCLCLGTCKEKKFNLAHSLRGWKLTLVSPFIWPLSEDSLDYVITWWRNRKRYGCVQRCVNVRGILVYNYLFSTELTQSTRQAFVPSDSDILDDLITTHQAPIFKVFTTLQYSCTLETMNH